MRLRSPIGLLLIVAVAIAACGASARQTALKSTLIAVNATSEAFVKWDGERQLQIVDKATTREEATVNLTTHRAKRDKVVDAFVIIYRLIATASALEDDHSLNSLAKAFADLKALIEEVRR